MPTRTADVAALYDAERDGTVVLRLHVQPGGARSEVVGPHGEALRVRVAAPAVEGRANAAVVRLLADSLGLRRSDVALVGGSTGRRKRVRLQGVDARRLTRWLEEIAAAPARSSK